MSSKLVEKKSFIFVALSVIQLMVAIPFDHTSLMPIFGFLSLTWTALALILMANEL